jgi:hypothetical protein
MNKLYYFFFPHGNCFWGFVCCRGVDFVVPTLRRRALLLCSSTNNTSQCPCYGNAALGLYPIPCVEVWGICCHVFVKKRSLNFSWKFGEMNSIFERERERERERIWWFHNVPHMVDTGDPHHETMNLA